MKKFSAAEPQLVVPRQVRQRAMIAKVPGPLDLGDEGIGGVVMYKASLMYLSFAIRAIVSQ